MANDTVNITSGWDRFKRYIDCTWDTVYEAGLGDPTHAESQAILDLGYWGKEITKKTVNGIKAGKEFSKIEKKKFVFRILAPDGTHTHRHGSRAKMIEDVKRYGPPVYRRSPTCWTDDDGYRYQLEGMTLDEVFVEAADPVPAPAPADAPDQEPDFDKLYEQHLDRKTEVDPREL